LIRSSLAKLARVAGGFRMPKPDPADVLAAVGIATIAIGVALIYPPAGLIVLGVLLLVVSVGLVRIGVAR
jgi:hypothetical protein